MNLDFIEILKVIFLGIVEGVTEWLPISSTGHMLLVDEFIKLNVSKDFKELFFVVIQLGAILAVVQIYFKKLWPFAMSEPHFIKKDTFLLWAKIVVACLPGIMIWVPFDDYIEDNLSTPVIIIAMLIFYGVAFIVIENLKLEKKQKITQLSQISFQTALSIGAFQVLSLIPGTSRSGATIIGAMLIGTSRYVAAEFTFFLAIPVMFGTSLLKLIKYGFTFTPNEIILLLLGMAVAFVVSTLVIIFLMGYIKKHNFKVFGYYRIILGVILAGYFLVV